MSTASMTTPDLTFDDSINSRTTVVHHKHATYDIYIGRPSKWGNPFRIGVDGDRLQVIEKYRQWLLSQPELVEQVKRELRGKVLGCWCHPRPCHGDVLADIANDD